MKIDHSSAGEQIRRENLFRCMKTKEEHPLELAN
jgi:hypothetical protein